MILALENLAIARREGKHAVIANRRTFRSIKDHQDISEHARGVYSHLEDQATQILEYTSFVNTYIELNAFQYEITIENSHGKKIIRVPPRFFEDSESIQKTILLCEDLRDTNWYKALGEVAKIWKGTKGICIKFEPRSGGGTGIKNEYLRLQAERHRICLCILDGDLEYPEDTPGNTASSVQSCHDNSYDLIDFIIINSREIENLLPYQVLGELIGGNPQRSQAFEVLEKLQGTEFSQARLFIDLKNGILTSKILQRDCSQYWRKIAESIESVKHSCLNNWECSQPSSCSCYVVLGFGEHLLDNSISWLDQNGGPPKLAKIVDDIIRPEYERIGQEIFSWGFALSPLRAS